MSSSPPSPTALPPDVVFPPLPLTPILAPTERELQKVLTTCAACGGTGVSPVATCRACAGARLRRVSAEVECRSCARGRRGRRRRCRATGCRRGFVVVGGVEICGECGGGQAECREADEACQRCGRSGVVVCCVKVVGGRDKAAGEVCRSYYPTVRQATLQDFMEGADVRREMGRLA
jgi:hypothetical protein